MLDYNTEGSVLKTVSQSSYYVKNTENHTYVKTIFFIITLTLTIYFYKHFMMHKLGLNVKV